MTRIGTFAQSQVLSTELMRLSRQEFKTQQQISTGKEASRFSEMPKDASVLLSARGVESKLSVYTRAAQEARTRLDIQDLQLENLAELGDQLRQTVTTSVANDSGILLMEEIEQIFRSAAGLLNSQLDGNYLYAGTLTDQPPVTSSNIADLVAAGAAGDLFANNDLKASVRVDDSVTVEFGVLADEAGEGLFTSLKRIADYNAGPNGPFGEQLTPDQKAFLEGELTGLKDMANALNATVARNGLAHQEIERAITRHEASDVFIKGFISDIEDVDLAEAITRLNNDQVAVEASTRMLADLNRLSLLNFI